MLLASRSFSDVRAAAIGHVQDVDPGLVLHDLEPEMRDRAVARGAVAQLAGIGLCVGDHLLEGLHADRRMNDEAGDRVADAADREEILLRIVGRLLQERQDRQRGAWREEERVSVGRRLHHRLGADHATGAAAVLDHELLAEGLAERLGPGARDDVARAARRIRYHKLDRPRGPRGLRRRAAGNRPGKPCGGKFDEIATAHDDLRSCCSSIRSMQIASCLVVYS